jgi:hypothetical protein
MLQFVTVSIAHMSPVVFRRQLATSMRDAAVHVPVTHVWSVQVRLWVPDSSHIVSKPSHSPNGPHSVPAPHTLPSFLGLITQPPALTSQTPCVQSLVIDEQSTGGNVHVNDARLQVPCLEQTSGGVRQSTSLWQPTGGASGGLSTGASDGPSTDASSAGAMAESAT